MLVLTRKADEQILIGDNIKITLVRVRGNSVRIGIDAPREIRIVRGELDALDSDSDLEIELDDRSQVFAHPQVEPVRPAAKRVAKRAADRSPQNRVSHLIDDSDSIPAAATNRSIFVGRVHRPENANQSSDAPLAGVMSPRHSTITGG